MIRCGFQMTCEAPVSSLCCKERNVDDRLYVLMFPCLFHVTRVPLRDDAMSGGRQFVNGRM